MSEAMSPGPRARRRRGGPGAALVVTLAAGVLSAACGGDTGPVATPTTAPAATAAASPSAPAPPAPLPPLRVRFAAVDADASGFGPMNHTGTAEEKQWIAEAMGGGMIVLDYDGDGDMDILVVDGNALEGEPFPEARTRLFRNDGSLRFTDVTAAAGIDVRGFGFGGAAADYDGDGHVDLYICRLGTNVLLRNRGDGTFEDVSAASGAAGPESDMSTACCWGDLDGDGRLDLYVANYVDMGRTMTDIRAQGRPGRSCEWRGIKVYCGPQGLPFQKDRLFRQREDGTFEDVSARLLDQVAHPGFQPVAADFDGDGDLDIYVANDTTENLLWVNDGKGTFRDEAVLAGCAMDANVIPQAGMGVDVADYDGDGLLDIIVTNFSHDHYTLYRNRLLQRKDGSRAMSFEDVSVRTGVSQATFYELGWGTHILDFDNDGVPDLFFANGHVYPEIDLFPGVGTTFRQRNQFLRGAVEGGEVVFRDAGAAAMPERREVHRGSAAADFDDDGDVDVAVSVLNGRAYLLRNDGGDAGSWVRLSLRGVRPRDPAGALVRVEAPGMRPATQVATRGNSFLCGSDPRMHFGLGAAKAAAKVTVRWPSGKAQEWRDLAAGREYLLVEGEPEARPRAR